LNIWVFIFWFLVGCELSVLAMLIFGSKQN